ncbi:MAG: hypothetical protein V3V96_14240 [Acidiferrobacterales bacterium]
MILYAIDPGPEESGVVAVRVGQTPLTFAVCGKMSNHTLLADLERGAFGNSTRLAIEMPQLYRKTPAGSSVLHTAKWVGIFQHAFGLDRSTEVLRSDVVVHLCGGSTYRDEQTGKLRGHGDTSVRAALIERFGPGKDAAIGGTKCKQCKGKGWCGRGQPMCHHCGGTKWEYPPGPLHGVTKDCWSALAVAVTYMDEHQCATRLQQSGATPKIQPVAEADCDKGASCDKETRTL